MGYTSTPTYIRRHGRQDVPGKVPAEADARRRDEQEPVPPAGAGDAEPLGFGGFGVEPGRLRQLHAAVGEGVGTLGPAGGEPRQAGAALFLLLQLQPERRLEPVQETDTGPTAAVRLEHPLLLLLLVPEVRVPPPQLVRRARCPGLPKRRGAVGRGRALVDDMLWEGDAPLQVPVVCRSCSSEAGGLLVLFLCHGCRLSCVLVCV